MHRVKGDVFVPFWAWPGLQVGPQEVEQIPVRLPQWPQDRQTSSIPRCPTCAQLRGARRPSWTHFSWHSAALELSALLIHAEVTSRGGGLATAEKARIKKIHSSRNEQSLCHFSNWRLSGWEMKESESPFETGSQKEKRNMTSYTHTHMCRFVSHSSWSAQLGEKQYKYNI